MAGGRGITSTSLSSADNFSIETHSKSPHENKIASSSPSLKKKVIKKKKKKKKKKKWCMMIELFKPFPENSPTIPSLTEKEAIPQNVYFSPI